MSWSNKTLSPDRQRAAIVRVRYPCPGLVRFAGMVSFLAAALGVYYGGMLGLGLEPIDWAAPKWTGKHLGLVAASAVLGLFFGLQGAATALKIEVRSERLSDLYIILWQFLANGGMIWFMAIGMAMSASLGQEEAKAAVLQFGMERAAAHVIGTGSVVGLLLGGGFFIARVMRLPCLVYLVASEAIALVAARWHFGLYGIEGRSWMVAGALVPILLLLFAPGMVDRDRRQRRLAMEQSG